MGMSRKHYNQFVEMINQIQRDLELNGGEAQVCYTRFLIGIVEICKKDNPKFDVMKFYEGLEVL